MRLDRTPLIPLLAASLWCQPLPGQAGAAPAIADGAAVAVHAGALPAGKGALTLTIAGTSLDLFTYKPASYRGERMILVLHGVLRNADEYRDHACAMGDRCGALIVAPRFDAERFPSRRYQQGGIRDRAGQALPPAEWTYALIPRIAGAVRDREGLASLPWWIIGHSAGGQFVARMSAFQQTGAVRHVAANPGSHLFPTRDMQFGYGFGGLPAELSGDDVLRRYLAAPLTIYLGTADNAPDQYFDASEHAMAQGAGRHQRGQECFRRAQALAQERGWQFGWRLVEADGVGHDHERMFDHPACERALFGAASAGDR